MTPRKKRHLLAALEPLEYAERLRLWQRAVTYARGKAADVLLALPPDQPTDHAALDAAEEQAFFTYLGAMTPKPTEEPDDQDPAP